MCVHVGGIGAGRCPFFSRLNSVPAFNRSDRMGSVEKVGVAPDPKRVGPASGILEYG